MALVPHGAWTAGVVIYALCGWDCLLSMFLHLSGICAPLPAWRGEARRRKYSSKKKKMRNGSREIYKEDTIYSYVFSRAGQEQMTYLFLSGRCLNLHIQMQNWCFFNRIHINIQYSSIFHYWGFKWAGFITSMGGDIECLQGSGGETGHSEGRVTKEMITLR
jgi:hypothetical protein